MARLGWIMHGGPALPTEKKVVHREASAASIQDNLHAATSDLLSLGYALVAQSTCSWRKGSPRGH
eukprot:8120171-Pyramimonas_sp.AAC.1